MNRDHIFYRFIDKFRLLIRNEIYRILISKDRTETYDFPTLWHTEYINIRIGRKIYRLCPRT